MTIMIAEAFACGVLVVGSDRGKFPYVVEDDEIVI